MTTFKEDRLWNPPADTASYDEKISYQRKLRAAWDSCEKPSDCIDIPLPVEGLWYTHPEGLPPKYIQKQIQRQMKRLMRDGR
jgi:hypothetical protein